MMDHGEARELIREGARRCLGREPTPGEVEAAQAVALSETGYGSRWKEAGGGSNNWGAILATSSSDPQFNHRDENESGPYVAGFRIYATPAEGAAAVAREVLCSRHRPGVVAAIASGSLEAFSRALFGYYRPRQGQSVESRIADHADSIDNAIAALELAGLGRSLRRVPFDRPGPFRPAPPLEAPSSPPSSSPGSDGLGVLVALGLVAWAVASSSSRRPSRGRRSRAFA
jgi:hypothetical protein